MSNKKNGRIIHERPADATRQQRAGLSGLMSELAGAMQHRPVVQEDEICLGDDSEDETIVNTMNTPEGRIEVDFLTVILERPDTKGPLGLGLATRDGTGTKVVVAVYVGTPADGKVQVNDMVLFVNNCDVTRLSHEATIELVKTASMANQVVELRIARPSETKIIEYETPPHASSPEPIETIETTSAALQAEECAKKKVRGTTKSTKSAAEKPLLPEKKVAGVSSPEKAPSGNDESDDAASNTTLLAVAGIAGVVLLAFAWMRGR